MKSKLLMAYCTFPDLECAERICRDLIDSHLIACANIQAPHLALYRWEDALQRETEISAWLKTSLEKKAPLKQRFAELHPYDVPCLVFTDISDGLDPYKDWVLSETR